MTTVHSTPRALCAVCHRPQSACICQWITPVEHTTEVLILQHPLEVDHAKNSARLLHLSLPHSQILVGEVFDEDCFRVVLEVPKFTLLLYPQTQPVSDSVWGNAVFLHAQRSAQLRLVVLDATWRKSRKMLHLSPLLQALPRLSLDGVPESHYAIRKAHKPGQLSTLEAACTALAQLENDAEKFKHLLQAFKGFVAQQQAFVPHRV